MRTDPAALERAFASEPARFIIVRDDRSFIPGRALDADEAASVALAPDVRAAFASAAELPLFLGLTPDGPLFALDLSALPAERVVATLPPGDFMALRDVTARLSAPEAARTAFARALAYWHRTHRFCPNCGSGTHAERGGHVRRCSNAACGREHYPHINPAVIMLVSRRDERGISYALLGRHRGLLPGMYSTLAGFIEPGESLEEAVAREVFEEAGVHVGGVRYFGSQPWPFPAGLMLGFHAEAASEAIALNDGELDDARWFSADDVAAFGEWGDSGEGLRVPRRDSIARALIDAWLATARREK